MLFCKQKTAYEMRISDWSSDVGSTDLVIAVAARRIGVAVDVDIGARIFAEGRGDAVERATELALHHRAVEVEGDVAGHVEDELVALALDVDAGAGGAFAQLLFLDRKSTRLNSSH